MPPHKTTRNSLNSGYLVAHQIVSSCVNNGFYIVPEKMFTSTSLTLLKKIVYTGDLVYIMEETDSIQTGIDTINQILTVLSRVKNQNQIVSREWNYLGQTQEKERYIEYLQNYFWQHHSDESLMHLESYSTIIQEPWKILEFGERFSSLLLPDHVYSDDTVAFLDKLHDLLSGFDVNPYLIHSPNETFHWKIESKKIQIKGSIGRRKSKLRHRIVIDYLTKTDKTR